MAAEIGTRKVISEHSTIGLVITTDGSISDIPRDEYEEAEERVIGELKEIDKPFIVLLNCMYPNTNNAHALAAKLMDKYAVPVVPVNCLELDEEEIRQILSQVLFEFPVKEISIDLPRWITSLKPDHWLRSAVCKAVEEAAKDITHIREVNLLAGDLCSCEYIENASISNMDLASGSARINAVMNQELFFKVLAETTGFEIENEQHLMSCMCELAEMKKSYDRIKGALDEVEATGYGIVMPTLEELSLEEPEIMRQGGRYGVRLCASAPSIHIDCYKQKLFLHPCLVLKIFQIIRKK